MIMNDQRILDVHSHILPGVDDGSRNTDESRQMLELLCAQGVKRAIATPHFLANRDSVDGFIDKRNKSYDSLKEALNAQAPEILLGAEVEYYPGISRLDGLCKLCIEGTDAILVEMPMSKWSKYVADELINMSATRNVRVIIAHFERCMGYQDPSVIESIYNSDVLLQINASFILNLHTRRKALKLLKDRRVHFIGSDCHNISSRRPRIGEAYDIVERKLGAGFVDDLLRFSEYTFNVGR